MKRTFGAVLGFCLAVLAVSASASPTVVTRHELRPAIHAGVFDPMIALQPDRLFSIIDPITLKPAPPVLGNAVAYPYGAANGEQVWIDSANGPQTILFAPLIATTAGTPTKQISATTGKKIRVLGIVLSNLAAGSAQFQDEAGSPNLLSGVFELAANTTTILPYNSVGYLDTAAGAALDIATTGSSNVQGGFIIYCLH